MVIALQEKLLLFVLGANVLMSLYVLVRNPRSYANWSFFVFVSGIAVLGSGIVLLFTTRNFVFDKVVFLGGYTIIVGLLMLARTFPEERGFGSYFLLSICPLFILVLLTPFNFFVAGVAQNTHGQVMPILGTGMPLFILVIGSYVVYSAFIFYKNYRKLVGLPRLQMQYLFLGAIIFVFSSFVFNALLPGIFGISGLNFIGPMSSIFFVTSVTYAMVRHRLLDIHLIVTRAVSFVILIGAMSALYAFVLTIALKNLFGEKINNVIILNIVVVSTVAILTFNPLYRFVIRLTKRIFFRDKPELDSVLSRLTRIMTSTIDLNELIGKALVMLVEDLEIEKAAFLIIDNHKLIDMKGIGYKDHEYASAELERRILHDDYSKNTILTEDNAPETLRDLFHKLDIVVAIPMKVEERDIAILVLGRKRSGEIYYDNELNFLRTFAHEAAVAIQNAKSYLEIKRLNEGLEALVEERTKELKESQEQELAKAREVTRLKDEFVFIAAHELRAPVAAIKGFVELIEDDSKNMPRQTQQYLNSVSGASVHLTKLVDDILEIARSEAGAAKTTLSQVSLTPVVQATIKEFSSLAQERNVRIKLEAQGIVSAALADEDKVREVISNLISNGIKYNKVGGSLDIRIFSEENNVVMEFKDTGIGIQKDEQGKIFGKFFRSGDKAVRTIRGTGLGLFITRMLAEKMGGGIKFNSVEGQGTTFVVSLPTFRSG